MSSSSITLRRELRELASDFVLDDEGALALDGHRFAYWRGRLTQFPRAEQPEIAVQLIALAFKFHRLAPCGSTKAIERLAELAVALELTSTQARDLFSLVGKPRIETWRFD